MKVAVYAHNRALDALNEDVVEEVHAILDGVQLQRRENGAKFVRTAVVAGLEAAGWDLRVKIAAGLGLTITAMKQRVALCAQFGNVARMYADLLKLQHVYVSGASDGAIMIVQRTDVANDMASNLAQDERLVRELKAFGGTISTPILVIGVSE